MMMRWCAVLSVVLAVAAAADNDNRVNGEERVLMVSPVLAAPEDSRPIHFRSRQFPVLVLLAQKEGENRREADAKSLQGYAQPIYVQKLEDQDNYSPKNLQKSSSKKVVYKSPQVLNRHKRHLLKKHLGGFGGGGLAFGIGGFGGGSGGYSHGGYGGGGYGGGGYGGGGYGGHNYQQPTKTVVVHVVNEQGGHGGGHGHGGYGNGGHGNGGGYGGGGGYSGGGYGGGGGGYGGGGGGYGGGGGGYGGGGNGGGNYGGGGGGGGQASATATATATASASSNSGYNGYGKR